MLEQNEVPQPGRFFFGDAGTCADRCEHALAFWPGGYFGRCPVMLSSGLCLSAFWCTGFFTLHWDVLFLFCCRSYSMNLLQFAALCLTSGLVVVFAVVASLFSRRTANVILAGGITVAALLLCTCTCFMFVLRDLHFVSCVPFWLQDLHLPFYCLLGAVFRKKRGV